MIAVPPPIDISEKVEKLSQLTPSVKMTNSSVNELSQECLKQMIQHSVQEALKMNLTKNSRTNTNKPEDDELDMTFQIDNPVILDQKTTNTNSWKDVVKRSKIRKTVQKLNTTERSRSRNRPKSKTLVGTTGTTYMGLKDDVCLKLQMAKSISLQDVKNIVASAGQITPDKVAVEELNSSSRNYANAYRCTAKEVTQPIAVQMVKDPSCWPSGVIVEKWLGRRTPIIKRQTIKIFVGNLGSESSEESVAQKIQKIYEKHNVQIQSASAIKFVGKKTVEQINGNVKNFIATIQATKEGIDMEPIRLAIQAGEIPTSLYIRRYNEKPAKVSW